jgi:hypothetical protein
LLTAEISVNIWECTSKILWENDIEMSRYIRTCGFLYGIYC